MYTPSFWERETVFKALDVVVIGSGIVGLNAALNIKLHAPALNVMVIDRGFLPYGASTRNAGFCCFGSMTELIDDLTKESENAVFARVAQRWEGLRKLRSLLGDENIEYEPLGGYEVFTQQDESSWLMCSEKMAYFNSALADITNEKITYKNADEKINEFGFSQVNHLILNNHEGQINTGRMMDVLAEKTRQSGVRIINGLGIHAINNSGEGVLFECDNGFTFNSKRVLVANNGFAKTLLPILAVTPARAQVLITKPIENLKIKGSFHYDKGYYYFRNVGNRILFGGGRNLDFDGETTNKFGTTSFIQDKLDTLLKEIILPEIPYETDMRWSGIMGLGPSKTTILKKVDGNVFCAVRMGGMGIAIGSLIGEDAANMICESF